MIGVRTKTWKGRTNSNRPTPRNPRRNTQNGTDHGKNRSTSR
jgi:hypothetical protein